MDSVLQLIEQVIRFSHVYTTSTLAIDATINKQGCAHCVISLTCLKVLFISMKKSIRGNRNPDLRVILILYVAVLIRNLENNKDITEITSKYYLEEFNLIKSFDTNTGMFSSSFQFQSLEELQEFKDNQF